MTATASTRTVSRPSSSRPRLGPRLRKAVLVAHILSAASWIGIDVVVAVLVGVGRAADPQTAALAYRALGTFVLAPMLTAALATLATGLVLGWGTKWGLVRYWWVLAKLLITLVLTVLIVLALRPSLPEAVTYGEQLAKGVTPTVGVGDLVFPPIVSLTALSLATVLSVVKPRGRVRRDEGGPDRSGRGPLRAGRVRSGRR